jgi:hypothetical protein
MKLTLYQGLNRGANNKTNTLTAAKSAMASMKYLHALELGNEPVSPLPCLQHQSEAKSSLQHQGRKLLYDIILVMQTATLLTL